jgi:flagellar basal body-associated protein FliL
MTNEFPNEQPVEENRPPETSEEEPSVDQIPAAQVEPVQESEPHELESPMPKSKTFWQQALRWVLIVLLSLAAGFALCFFFFFMPANSNLTQEKITLADTKASLEVADAKSADLQTRLTDANSQLKVVTDELDSIKVNLYLARLQTNISYARLALINKDTLTARQELSGADENLVQLTLVLNDSETASTLADRLKNIRLDLTGDPSKALDELRILSENLDRLGDR